MILQIVTLSIFALACTSLAAWSSYKLTLNLLSKVLIYQGNLPIPSRYALDELKFSFSTEEA